MEGEREWGGGCGGEVGAVGGFGGVCAGDLCVVYAYDGAAAEGFEGEVGVVRWGLVRIRGTIYDLRP